MKRPLALIGLTSLCVFAVVYYFYSLVLCVSVILFSLVVIIFAIIFGNKYTRISKTSLIAFGITAVISCSIIFCYMNYIYKPIINEYSNKNVSITGFVDGDIEKNSYGSTFVINTYKINSVNKNIKIRVYAQNTGKLKPFEKINCNLNLCESNYDKYKSNGEFLSTNRIDNFSYNSEHKYETSLFSLANKVNSHIKDIFDKYLDNNSSSMCKAVLLGDKNALDKDLSTAFTNTGVSFLIVVSGMHLAIITGFLLFIVRRFTKKKYISAICAITVVLLFVSISGFSRSVIRAGVMVIVTYSSFFFTRSSDSINSLGLSAVILIIVNPFAVGDIGMLLSFSATLGILLWQKPIFSYICKTLKIKHKATKALAEAFAVSLSATLWILPISIICFGVICPLTIPISMLIEPFVALLIIIALILFLVSFVSIPFLIVPLSFIANKITSFISFVIVSADDIPFSSINAKSIFFYIALAICLCIAIAGAFVKNKEKYAKYATLFSLSIVLILWSLTTIIEANTVNLKVLKNSFGTTAIISQGYNSSVLSSSGPINNCNNIIENAKRQYIDFDYIIIGTDDEYSISYGKAFASEFDYKNILIYDNGKQKIKADNIFRNNANFSLSLSDKIVTNICCKNNQTYQKVVANNKSVIILPYYSNCNNLDESFLNADIIVMQKLPTNYEKLRCDKIIFTGAKSVYQKNINELSRISNSVINSSENDVSINIE